MNRKLMNFKHKNKKNSSVKIFGLVGLAGSGKSEAVRYIKSKGYPHVYFGGVILQALKDEGLELNSANEKMMRERLRNDHGKDVVVNKMVEQINNLIEAGQKRIIADGIYSWTEYKILKKNFPRELKVLALVPPKTVRHRRIGARPDRALTAEEINNRDYSEIENLEKGGPIAIADYFIVNDGPVSKTRRKIDKILRQIDF